MSVRNLYCIALIPDPNQRKQIKQFKEYMSVQFGAKHALKSPAHITLQMPFRRSQEHELTILEALDQFATGRLPFKVHLNGFGCFAPKVIFVKVVDHQPITELHSDLIKVLEDPIGLTQKEIMSKVYPHMTIATRDLTREAFKLAWSELENRPFRSDFKVNSIHLLKHNGKDWDIYKEFLFYDGKEW